MQSKELTLRAYALAKSSPVQWQDFLQALASVTAEHKELLVNSQLDDLQVAQGRARALSSLYKLLAECVTNAEKLKKDKP